MYAYIHRYKPTESVYCCSFVCMYVFIVDHLGMGSLSRGLSLEKTESLSLSSYFAYSPSSRDGDL